MISQETIRAPTSETNYHGFVMRLKLLGETFSPTREDIDYALDHSMLWIAMSTGSWWQCRRNGKTKLWKREPDRFRIPLKAGREASSHGLAAQPRETCLVLRSCNSIESLQQVTTKKPMHWAWWLYLISVEKPDNWKREG